ncbi:MAG: hypothetical protein K2V38_15510 [Gemmataceae bacterium]|nr:hypothetical protein [Gemmataceae bacterium]
MPNARTLHVVELFPLSEPHASADPLPVWQSATVATLAEAEALLDAAERAGFTERELTVCGPSTFLIRWR